MSAPPLNVLREFHRSLVATVFEYEETLVPVLRGSLLMKIWFGDRARPAADIDLECFEGPTRLSQADQYRQTGLTGYGDYREYTSLVDFGKAMCRYAAEESGMYRWTGNNQSPPAIEFFDIQPPDPNTNLWVYGTPGERFFTGWRINDLSWRSKLLGSNRGQLQIDIAEPGVYQLADIGTESILIEGNQGDRIEAITYSRGMMLAAKLSWIMRSFDYPDGSSELQWRGEPKDLFDAHLLLQDGQIDPEDFQRSLVAVGLEDDLEWDHLVQLISRRHQATDDQFENWNSFASGLPDLVRFGPAECLRDIAEHLPDVLGRFWLPQEDPFLKTIAADRGDQDSYIVYADWLEERGDGRADFLREFAPLYCGSVSPGSAGGNDQRLGDGGQLEKLKQLIAETSQPWLHRLFGRGQRLAEMRGRIESGQIRGAARSTIT